MVARQMSEDPILSGDSCHLSTTAIEIWLSAVAELLLVFAVHMSLKRFPSFTGSQML